MFKGIKKVSLEYNLVLAELSERIELEFPILFETMERIESFGWKIVATNQKRGFCEYNKKIITIPLFAFHCPDDFVIYYIAHEIAHAIIPTQKEPHNQVFMQALKRICPAHCIHFELGYKPRNASKAGIQIEIPAF